MLVKLRERVGGCEARSRREGEREREGAARV